VREIDEIIDKRDQNLLAYELQFEDGSYLDYENSNSGLTFENYDINTNDPIAQNDDFDVGISDILDFTEKNPFGEVFNR
jgi:hypothetical protein